MVATARSAQTDEQLLSAAGSGCAAAPVPQQDVGGATGDAGEAVSGAAVAGRRRLPRLSLFYLRV